MVYEAVGALMETDIHALSINAYTDAERPEFQL
jgi:acid stress-induced BolA-like protein IbaG/YrbA